MYTIQASVTLSNRQRYFVRHRTGYQTALCITHLSKDILKDKATYTKYVKDLISESESLQSMCQSPALDQETTSQDESTLIN